MKTSHCRILPLLLAFLLLLSLAACKAKDKDIEADGMEAANAYGSAFIAETLKQTNLKMTMKADGKTVLEFVREGDRARVSDPSTGDDTYAFVTKDGKYCIAYSGGTVKEVYESKTDYYDPQMGTAAFWLEAFFTSTNETLTEWTFHTLQTNTVEDGKKVSKIEISSSGSYEGQPSSQLSKATSVDGLLQIAETKLSTGENSVVYTLEFTYGNAKVTIPDLSEYENNSGSPVEIDFGDLDFDDDPEK